jgi:hypothetical protein
LEGACYLDGKGVQAGEAANSNNNNNSSKARGKKRATIAVQVQS